MNHELRIRNQGQRTVLCRGKGLSFAYCALMFFSFLAFLLAVPVPTQAAVNCCIAGAFGETTCTANATSDSCIGGTFDPSCSDPACTDLSPTVIGEESTEAEKGLSGAVGLVDIFGARIGFPPRQNPQPEIIVGKIIQGLMLLIGVIFGILVIYGGYMWMIARGNEEYVKKAINILQTAVIGLIIVVAAYAITNYVIDVVISSTFTD